jgi:hypothetical protein
MDAYVFSVYLSVRKLTCLGGKLLAMFECEYAYTQIIIEFTQNAMGMLHT